MSLPFRFPITQATLAQRFMLASLLILIAGMAGIGVWIGNEIKNGVIHRAGATTALYVDSFVAPILQELGNTGTLSPEHHEKLETLLQDTPLGQQIVTFRVWDPTGKVIFSTDATTLGKTFPISEELAQAIWGQVSSEISQLEDEENAQQRTIRSELLETYSPVRLSGTNQVIAVAEFYQTVDTLNQEIAAAQRRSWLVVGAVTLGIYVLLAGFVQRSSDTIARQQTMLNSQISRLTELLTQNKELHDRVRRAAGSVATLNERFLRRIGSELHDGPAQDMGLALLKLDALIGRWEQGQAVPELVRELTEIQSSLQNAQKEVRAISTGLSLPQLAELSLPQAVIRAVRAHERRTGSRVKLDVASLPEQAALPVKITVYRVIQESLNNSYRHAGGANQQLRAFMDGNLLALEITDEGPGFVPQPSASFNGHLGLAGMRERVESLGGRFSVKSEPGNGTQVTARLPLRAEEGDHER
ncbi:MAG TPA: sensor histidine kinase [Anaerolineales bacterium]|jgi:signal transduction histidine kinase|nr:sensor histidine kinase [Anaerolineales bacterium]